jgi:hypothetical protein
MGNGGPWLTRAIIMARPDYRFKPAITEGPATLLHLDDPSGPYRSTTLDGRSRGAASILGGGGGRELDCGDA